MKLSGLCSVTMALCWCAYAGMASGQSPDSTPVPKMPLLARAPDGSWSVAYKYKNPPAKTASDTGGAPAQPPDLIASVRIEKKGAQYHVITTMSSGSRSEKWYANGVEIYKAENNSPFVRLSPDNAFYMNFANADFDELSWIGMDNFKGVQTERSGAKEFIFEVKNVERRQTGQENALTGDLGTAVEKAGLVGAKEDKKQIVAKLLKAQFGDTVSHALIDVDTQMPVEYDDGQIDRKYTYSLDPPFVPPDILQVFQKMKEQTWKATVRAPQP